MLPDDTKRTFFGARESLVFLLLLAVAAACYLYRLTYSDIWVDEAFSKAVVRHPLPDLLRQVAHDSHPPLYFVALKGFTGIVGNTDFTIRLFSVLGALAAAVLGYVKGRRVFGPAGALSWSVLLLALPMPGLYSHVARMYTWAAFLTIGVYLYAVLYAREGRRADLGWLGLFSVLAAYTHYYSLIAAFWIASSLLLYLAVKKNPAWRGVAVMGVAVFLLYLPWAFVLGSQAATVHKDFWIPPVSWGSVLTCYAQPFGGFFRFYHVSWGLLIAVYGLTLASVVSVVRSPQAGQPLPLVFALVGVHATILTAIVVSLAFRPVLYPRYLMTVVPLLLVPPVVAMMGWRRLWPRRLLLTGWFGCGLFVVLSESSFSFGPYQQALGALAQKHPAATKILHLNEVTASPFAEYGRAGPWKQYYLRNEGTSWYSNMEMHDGMNPVRRLSEMVEPGEIFCLTEFVGLPLNRQNLDLVASLCDTLAIEDVVDQKPYSGIALKLHILKVRL